MRRLLFAAAVLTFVACKREGRILGPSGITVDTKPLTPSCRVPCKSDGSCPAYAPAVGEVKWVWQGCVDGACVDVECNGTNDCAMQTPPPACTDDASCASPTFCSAPSDCTLFSGGAPCVGDPDCAPFGNLCTQPKICRNLECRTACTSDGFCRFDERCDNGACVPRPVDCVEGQCAQACASQADCDKISTAYECRGGRCLIPLPHCVAGECQRTCRSTADCGYYSGANNSVCLAGVCRNTQVVCADHSCASQCDSEDDCDVRDDCVNGRCVRQPEKIEARRCCTQASSCPTACDFDARCAACTSNDCVVCQGNECAVCNPLGRTCFLRAAAECPPCDCDEASDCPEWAACRSDSVCRGAQNDWGTAASGRGCADDQECGRKHMLQDMLIAGLNSEVSNHWFGGDGNHPQCADQCADTNLGLTPTCGAGFVCTPPFASRTVDKKSVQRRTCLPTACAAPSCISTLAPCENDPECTAAGEKCAFPTPGCIGACLKVDCPSCATWLSEKRTRACITPPAAPTATVAPPDVRRPD
ncbi:MAG: hypothetical protein IT381_17500 [Deltaproteobacteria bacterium]|nr:hypothetical protein [Deltaproteobacteria bacterium]